MPQYIEEDMQKRIQNLEVGDKFVTKLRVISKTDVELFSIVTGATNPMFLSEEHAREYGWNKQIVPGLLSYSIAIGLLFQSGLVADVRAYMATDKMKFTAPLFVNDAVRIEVEVLSKRKTSQGNWICSYKWALKNQHGDAIGEGENTAMVKPG